MTGEEGTLVTSGKVAGDGAGVGAELAWLSGCRSKERELMWGPGLAWRRPALPLEFCSINAWYASVGGAEAELEGQMAC